MRRIAKKRLAQENASVPLISSNTTTAQEDNREVDRTVRSLVLAAQYLPYSRVSKRSGMSPD
ncbi:hypothetical protein Z949_2283 [Sulfitobacter guttiformis KCTC 32187]|uniref:Uncharacterized protein n=1 Tax=Sulfitobacter guttiformis TaxID=74349 RepID=A0A420DNC6_9RHOB|nr:hypothetical protein Z949_2283 [Sulfitobacter guttiformis KCTC 32187]RKE95786.1 hypothetical protein C8N30_0325 [Sulfitobacter guttiformis]